MLTSTSKMPLICCPVVIAFVFHEQTESNRQRPMFFTRASILQLPLFPHKTGHGASQDWVARSIPRPHKSWWTSTMLADPETAQIAHFPDLCCPFWLLGTTNVAVWAKQSSITYPKSHRIPLFKQRDSKASILFDSLVLLFITPHHSTTFPWQESKLGPALVGMRHPGCSTAWISSGRGSSTT